MADQKLTDRQSLGTSSSDSSIHIVQGGTSYKQTKGNFLKEINTRIDENQYSGVIVYELYSTLTGVTGVVNTSYKVTNDPDTALNGYYHYDGGWVKDASLANGEVASGNIEAVEGGKIFDYTYSRQDIIDSGAGLFTLQPYTNESVNGYYNKTTGAFVVSNGQLSRKYTVSPTDEIYATGTISGTGIALVCYYDISDTFISSEFTALDNNPRIYDKKLLNIPANTNFIGISVNNSEPYGLIENLVLTIAKEADLQEINSKQMELLEEALGYVEESTFTNESVNGYYDESSGVFVANTGHRSRKYSVDESETFYGTGYVAGTGIALACYYDISDVFISSEFTALDNNLRSYERVELSLPSGTAFIGLSTVYFPTIYPYGVVEKGVISIITTNDLDDALADMGSKVNKVFAWFGTSIPATGYPDIVGTSLGATVYNEAVPSSMARAFHGVTGTFKDLGRDNCLRSLSQTLADKQNLIDNWKTGLDANGDIFGGGTFGWRDFISGVSNTSEITDYDTEANILGYSYEKKLEHKYLDSTHPDFIETPDYFVFEHSHNDLILESYDTSIAESVAIPPVRNDRSILNGAMNYLIDLILTYNARAKIIIISHYENQKRERITDSMQVLSDYWSVPYFKMYEKLGLSQNTVTTTGYWLDSTTWIESGGASQQLTQTEIAFEDDLHPYSDETKQKFARALSLFLTTEIS